MLRNGETNHGPLLPALPGISSGGSLQRLDRIQTPIGGQINSAIQLDVSCPANAPRSGGHVLCEDSSSLAIVGTSKAALSGRDTGALGVSPAPPQQGKMPSQAPARCKMFGETVLIGDNKSS